MNIIYPKCGIARCGSREFRLICALDIGKQKTKYLYQCSHGHVVVLDNEIVETKNPLEVVK